MTNYQYYMKIEMLLENNITSIKKMSYLIPDSDRMIKSLSDMVTKTRELKTLCDREVLESQEYIEITGKLNNART